MSNVTSKCFFKVLEGLLNFRLFICKNFFLKNEQTQIRYLKSVFGGGGSVILWTRTHRKIQLSLEVYLKMAGSFKDSLNIGVCEVGSAGVSVVQQHCHCLTVQAFYFHTLLVTLP